MLGATRKSGRAASDEERRNVSPGMLFFRYCLCCPSGRDDASPGGVGAGEQDLVDGLGPKILVVHDEADKLSRRNIYTTETGARQRTGTTPEPASARTYGASARTGADGRDTTGAEDGNRNSLTPNNNLVVDQEKKNLLKRRVKKFVKQACGRGLKLGWLNSRGNFLPSTFNLDTSLLFFTLRSGSGSYVKVFFSECERMPEKVSATWNDEDLRDKVLRLHCNVRVVDPGDQSGATGRPSTGDVTLSFENALERESFWSCIQVVSVIAEKRSASPQKEPRSERQ